jgi:hypothetical protein
MFKENWDDKTFLLEKITNGFNVLRYASVKLKCSLFFEGEAIYLKMKGFY